MAQQDTGLGWSANEEWLIFGGSSVVASLNDYRAIGYPNQPLPYTPTVNDVQSGGLYIGYTGNQTQATGREVYIGVKTENVVVFVTTYTTPSGNNFFGFFSPTETYTLIYANKRYNQWYRDGEVNITGVIDPTTGLYFYGGWGHVTAGVDGYSSDVIPYADAANVIVAQSANFYKDNEGYAVGCLVKWKTQNGTELISPILISSDTTFVDMTTQATGHYIAKFNGLLSGVRFYMAFWDYSASSSFTTTLPDLDLTDRGNITLEQLFMIIASTANAHITIINSPDPYEEEGGGSGEEGGDGEDTGDDDAGIEAGSDFPSAINTGFCRIFSPSESDLRDLSNYLWSNSYDLAQVKKLFSNPMDSILGLSAVPIRLLGSSVSFSLGGVPITGMTLPLVTQQRYTYHMGSITIKERWGSYLDYDPYTKFSIFLPFIGMRELAADDIMGKTVGLVYDIDILTGMCVARLQAGTNCLYEWGGNCAIQLPINSRNWDSVFSTAVSAVGGIVSAVTGGSAPLVAGSVASAALQTVSMKPRIDKSSTIGGAAGWLGQMTPYIIRTTPEAFIPTDQNKFIGYPAYINVGLDAISGYNEVESIHLENVTATGAELEEIESILKGGVIF